MDKIKCAKCFVTLEKLKKDGISSYMVKCVDAQGEIFVCRTCLDGWTD